MSWDVSCERLLARAGQDWSGLWSVLFAGGRAAFALSVCVPLREGVSFTDAAMDLREARDELEWAHSDLTRSGLAVDLGPLRPTDDTLAARTALGRLTSGALDRANVLAATTGDPAEQACLARVLMRIRSARVAMLEAVA